MKNLNTLFLANAQGGSGNIMMIVVFVILIGFMYFGMIRPQKKQQQKRMQMMDQLKKGDRVVLVDGLHGKVDSINGKDNTVVIDADGIYLTFSRMAIRQVLPAAEEKPASAETEKSEAPAEEKSAEKTETKEEPEAKHETEKPADDNSEEKKD